MISEEGEIERKRMSSFRIRDSIQGHWSGLD